MFHNILFKDFAENIILFFQDYSCAICSIIFCESAYKYKCNRTLTEYNKGHANALLLIATHEWCTRIQICATGK